MKSIMKKMLVLLVAIFVLTACSTGGTEKENAANNAPDNTAEQNTAEVPEGQKNIKVGIIQFTQHVALDRSREGFLEELEALGYTVEENTVNVSGEISLIPTTAKKFEGDAVDIIYAIATPAAQGAKNAVTDIPIIFNAVTDPQSAELVDTNEEPGGNVTGVSDYFSIETQLKNFLELFPDSKKLGVLYSTGEANSEAQIKELEEVTANLGIELIKAGVTTTNDVSAAMASLVTKIDSYVAIQDNLASSAASVISDSLKQAQIPSFAGEAGPVENGMLFSDGIDYIELGKSAGKIADEIINGKSPAEIPVIFSTQANRTVNKTTADALGIEADSDLFKDAQIVD
ncbi:MAG: ABC transporter substrate binding protein [Peptoniphilus sp.]|nr:ABC transporter substrate binding protein [Peptoniphilus sp.]